MTAQLRIFPETATTVLLVVPRQYDERLLRRAGSVAAMLGADLYVYCPVTSMLAPHSDVTPALSAEAVEVNSDRERARKVAGEVQFLLSEHNIDGYVEAGPCHSLTDGIMNAADKWKPDLLILPFIRTDSVLPRQDLIRYESVWSRLGIPVWIVNSDSPGGDNVAGYVAVGKRRGRGDQKDVRVCSAVARLASFLGGEAHLLSCLKPPAALAIAKEAFAPPTKSIAEIEDDSIAGEIHEMAGCHGIPQEHIHVHQGTAGSALADLVEPLQLGLVVSSGRSRSLLDRLSRRSPANEFLDQRCDVLVLGEPGAGIDVA